MLDKIFFKQDGTLNNTFTIGQDIKKTSALLLALE